MLKKKISCPAVNANVNVTKVQNKEGLVQSSSTVMSETESIKQKTIF